MSNPQTETEEFNAEVEQIEHAISMGEAWQRLQRNGDFKKIITNGYLNEKVLASVSLLGVPQMKGDRGSVMEDLVSASNLQFFFKMIEAQYEGAKNPILSDEEQAEFEAAQAEAEAAAVGAH